MRSGCGKACLQDLRRSRAAAGREDTVALLLQAERLATRTHREESPLDHRAHSDRGGHGRLVEGRVVRVDKPAAARSERAISSGRSHHIKQRARH
jgi:hypothetical protein